MKLCSRKQTLVPSSAHSTCRNKRETVSFTCTRPAANVPQVTNARSVNDQETRANKSADSAHRLFPYSVSAQKYAIHSPTLFTVSLWNAYEDNFRDHFWGNHYLFIIKWIIRELSRNVNSPGTSSLPRGNVTAQHSLRSLLLTHELGESPSFTSWLREVKRRLIKPKAISAGLSERLKHKLLACPWQIWI